VIPGARNPDQARANAATGRLGPVGPGFEAAVRATYDDYLRADIHPRW
jgi:hypothetical protein